jgi:hypothetical protein
MRWEFRWVIAAKRNELANPLRDGSRHGGTPKPSSITPPPFVLATGWGQMDPFGVLLANAASDSTHHFLGTNTLKFCFSSVMVTCAGFFGGRNTRLSIRRCPPCQTIFTFSP